MFAENFKMTVTLGQRIKSCEAFSYRDLYSHICNMHVASAAFADLLIKSTLVQLSVRFPSSQGSVRNP